MEVKPGYKQTEVGVIPDDWEVVRLGQSLRRTPSYGINAAAIAFDSRFPTYLRITDITEDGRFAEATKASVQHPASATYLLEPGDIVFARTGASVGKSYLYNPKDGRLVFAGFLIRLSPDTERLVPAFLSFFAQSCSYWRWVKVNCMRSGQPGINGREYATLPVPLPPTIAEQEAIAEVLSDVDALIESLEQLLVKKRDVKQGVMQELLRPKPSDEVRLLREVSSLKGRIGWQGLKQTEFTTNEDEPFLITGMNFKDGAIRWGEVYHISETRYEMAPDIQLKIEDVLMTKDGTIGKVLYIDTIPFPGKASLNSHLLLFRPVRGSYNPKYLYYQLGSRRFQTFVDLSKSGTTFFGLSQAAVGNYPVLLPPLEEQVHIAAILSDIDVEIAALEAKLTKARQLKQGMMQKLLTGRIRLV